jgi:GDP-L-fucose synthase
MSLRDNKGAKIYIADHRGLVGSAIWKNLVFKGYTSLIVKTHPELDLTGPAAVNSFFEAEKHEYVFLAAAQVPSKRISSIAQISFPSISQSK